MAKTKVLIAHTDDQLALDLRQTLKRLGYAVPMPLSDPSGVIASVAGARPGILLMDLNLLGRMEGCKTPGSLQEALEVPVVFLAGHARDPRLRMDAEPLRHGFLTLPARESDLAVAIELALQRQAFDRRLQEGEDRYRILFDTSPDPIAMFDLQGSFIMVNRQTSVMYGFESPGEFMAEYRSIMDVLSYDGRIQAAREINHILKDKQVPRKEYTFNTRDGRIFIGEVSSSLVCGSDGEPAAIISIIHNMTERRKMDEALALSEEKYRLLVENVNEAIVVVQDWRFSFINPKVEELSGYSREEVTSQPFTFLVHPDDCGMIADRHAGRLKGEILPEHYNCRIIKKGGEIRWVYINVVPVSWEGRPAFMTFLLDITESVIAQEELSRSEARYRFLAENAGDIIFTMDEHMRFTYISPSVTRIRGWTVEEAMVQAAADALTPSSLELAMDALTSALDREARGERELPRDLTLELEETCRDGSTIWTETTFSPLRHDDGSFAGFLGITRDISRRRQAEEALMGRQALLDSIISVAPTGIGVTKNRVLLEVNERICEMTGYTREELINQPAEMLYLTGEEYDFVGTEKYRQIREKGWGSVETRWKRKDGEIIDIIVSFRPIIEGDLSSDITFTALDISARKKVEDELRKLASAIEQAAECIVITDREGAIQYVNPAFEKVTGYAREEALGSNPRILKSGVQDQTFYEGLWRTITSGETWSGRLVNKRKNGSIYHEDAAISPIRDEGGRIVNFVGVKRDVTREVSLEEQLIRSQKLEAIGTLAGGIAHDFNNILSIIIGYTELVRECLPVEDPASEMVGEVLKAGERARDLVRQILTFSRKMESKREPVKVHLIAKETVKLLHSTIPKNITIREAIDPGAGSVDADPTKIHQVIMNLCTNAYHAMMPSGGTMTVSLKGILADRKLRERVPSLNPGPYLNLTVKDTGCGMGEDTVKRIFDPFFTTKEKGRGTGLGLAMVYGIVVDLGGAVTVESSPGKGSVFSVYMPVSRHATGEEAPGPGEEAVLRRKGRILLVDDEESIINFSRILLEGLGYSVTGVTGSREALSLFKSSPQEFDLVLSDCTMPELDGEGLSREILAIRPDIPVVLMTGFSESISEDKAKVLGIAHYIEKPFNKKSISRIISSCLGVEGA